MAGETFDLRRSRIRLSVIQRSVDHRGRRPRLQFESESAAADRYSVTNRSGDTGLAVSPNSAQDLD